MKDDYVIHAGRIEAILPDGRYRVILDNELHILASLAGRMRRFRFGSAVGDRVQVEMAGEDSTSGRIVVPGQTSRARH